MKKQATTISIVTYNSKKVFQTLDYLKNQIEHDPAYQVYIYDNGSDSAYLARLQAYVPFITLIESQTNQGFGHGHNVILNQANTQTGIIFNPDVLVQKKDLDAIVAHLATDSAIAAVAPRVLNADGTTQYLIRERITVYDYFLRFFPLKFDEKRLEKYECRNLSESTGQAVAMASGCFLGVDIEKFQAVGGFDERYFMYFEDNDLSQKINQAGYQIWYDPAITITHLYERASHKSLKMFGIFMRSMFQYFSKWGWSWF